MIITMWCGDPNSQNWSPKVVKACRARIFKCMGEDIQGRNARLKECLNKELK